ncbi:MAG TPA: hypothetical protein VHQ65_15365 [Thermoanaerobaculia bacterium]|nr:hypothetical protein [Thermoanaerobaculia bacterium]
MDFNNIRSIGIHYDALDDFMGRNPNTVYKEEQVIDAIRHAMRGGSEIYLHGGEQGKRYRFTGSEGSWRLGSD